MSEERKEVLSPIFRVSYPHLFTPQKSEDGESDVYSVTMLFEGDADLKGLNAILKLAKTKKFGANAQGKFKPAFRRGTSDEYDLKKNPEFEGKIIAVARSYNRPVGIVRIDKSKKDNDPKRFVPITNESEFYSGCYAIAKLSAYGYDHPKGGRGVTFGLQNILFVKHGEPLGVGFSDPESDFGEVDTSIFGDEDIDNDDLFGDDDLPF